MQSIRSRFFCFVRRTSSCWNWTGSVQGNGYGRFGVAGKTIYAHQAGYILQIGPISPGLCVLHKCDNRRCVRPDHLFLGTKKKNAEDCVAKDRQVRGERNGQAKLSERAVKFILSRKGRISSCRLGPIFNVHPNTILRIWKGERWKYLNTIGS